MGVVRERVLLAGRLHVYDFMCEMTVKFGLVQKWLYGQLCVPTMEGKWLSRGVVWCYPW